MARTAAKLATIQRTTTAASRERIREMLVGIRDELKGIDPILESIDDKNRRYSRISTERIRTQLYADSSLQGKIARIVRAIARGGLEGGDGLAHDVFRLRHLARASLCTRRVREVASQGLELPAIEEAEVEIAAAELRLRIANQLTPVKIADFLSRFCPAPGASCDAQAIVDDVDSYVRLIYAADYAEAREGPFPYVVQWGRDVVTVGRFRFRAHRFTRRRAVV